tara:strand:+ start:18 stop:1058 length:1041 start_codon:yes stop_codon:yes gene_type:complete
MSIQFDDLLARYRNASYGKLSSLNPSKVRNTLMDQEGLLGVQRIPGTEPFIQNIPTNEQKTVMTPTGEVRLNDFSTDQYGNPIFRMPGQLSEDGTTSTGGAASYDSSIDYGDSGYAKDFGGTNFDGTTDPITGTTSLLDTQERGGGRGQDRDGPGVSTEFIGGRAFRFNEDGTVTQLDPESLDFKFNNFMNNLLGYTPMNVAKGLLGLDDAENPNDVYNRIEEKYGEETALDFSLQNAKAINKEMNKDADARRAKVEKEFMKNATQEQKDRLNMTDKERGITSKKTTPTQTPGDKASKEDSKGFNLNDAREKQKVKDKAQRDKQKGGNPNRGEKNAGGGGFNAGGR